MPKEHGFALIGCGAVGAHHVTAISQLRNARLVAVCDTIELSARRFGERAGVPWYTDYHEMLERDDVDIVNVCTPSGLHMEPALAAMASGKHCVVEKPLEIALDRCDAMIAAAQKAGVLLGAIFPSRFGAAAQELKKAVDAGRFGRLTLGDAYVRWWREQSYYDSGGWRGTWKLDGGGALINQTIHCVDLIQWYMGPARAVTALSGCLAHERIEADDANVVGVEWASGALGAIQGTTAAWPGFPKKIAISGDAGSAVLEEESLTFWQFRKERPRDAKIRAGLVGDKGHGTGASDPMAFSPENHRRQLADFVRALERGTAPLVDGREGRKAVEIILAAYKSAETGTRVELPLSLEYRPGNKVVSRRVTRDA
ncbi:MAG: Gfo/Idh/MocA family oxidoreductase [Planctomycetes bacterium]|nr:Gfo/Idh/MocA family oxidoreductase [Planctomycetota bacterium]